MFAELASPITPEQRDALATRLLPCLDRQGWDQVIADLPPDIQFKFDDSPNLHLKITGLLRRCLNVNQGLELLLGRVRLYSKGTTRWKAAGQLAFQTLTRLPDEQAQRAATLLAMVEEIDPPVETIRLIYKQLSIELEPAPSNGYLALLQLFQLPEKTMARQFAGLLAETIEGQERNALRQWIGGAASVLRNPRQYLLIQLQPVTAGAERFEISSWLDAGNGLEVFTGDAEPYNLAEAIDEIGNLASAVINSVGADLEIELIVKQGLFRHDVNCWQVMIGDLSRALIGEAPLVFRCLERVEARRAEMARGRTGVSAAQAALARLREQQKGKGLINLAGWRKKWEALVENHESEIDAMLETVVAAGQDPGLLMDELSPQDKGLCVGLGFAPFEAAAGQEEFSAVLSTGVPIVIWFRELPPGVNLDAASLKQMLGGSKIKLAQMRRHLWELRRGALQKGADHDLCRNLSLLYDDYDRIPPPPAAQAPEQR